MKGTIQTLKIRQLKEIELHLVCFRVEWKFCNRPTKTSEYPGLRICPTLHIPIRAFLIVTLLWDCKSLHKTLLCSGEEWGILPYITLINKDQSIHFLLVHLKVLISRLKFWNCWSLYTLMCIFFYQRYKTFLLNFNANNQLLLGHQIMLVGQGEGK